ncbi:MAG: hypothetical protein MJ237_05310 [bacterium]|nr:hypothetical protein [bacterium]
MSKIRKLYCFDKKNVQEMFSFLSGDCPADAYIDRIIFNPLVILHYFLPFRFKYLPESYVLQDGKNLKGLITVTPVKSHQRKVEIKKLFFEENAFEVALELVQYVVSKYKAMGVTSVVIKVDDFLPELLTMLISKCNFSQISYEKLWQLTNFSKSHYDKNSFRKFRNSDAKAVANLYNESLLQHFRPLLNKGYKEFEEPFFKGLSGYSNFDYVIEDKKTKNITGYISIQTTDNENFIVEITQSEWHTMDIFSVLHFAYDKILKRKKKFTFYVKTNRYTTMGAKYENIFLDANIKCVQNRIVLTNSSARVLKTEEKCGKYTILNDFCPSLTAGNYE